MATTVTEISDFETFLASVGMKCVRREEPANAMGYRVIEYADAELRVRFTHEKGFWDVRLAEGRAPAETWYDARLFTYLFERLGQPNMPFADQLKYLRAHWPAILAAFDSTNRASTRAGLDTAKKDRARQVFMIWPTAVEDLGAFLESNGLKCTVRKEAEALYGPMRVEYANSRITVRMSSSGGWHVDFAGAGKGVKEWQSFTSIRRLIQWPEDIRLSYDEMFGFIKENWSKIADAFSPQNMAGTLRRLCEIEAGSPGN